MSFCLIGTPRSRTAWFARFLECEHEPSKRWRCDDDLRAHFAHAGACDSMLSLKWPLLRDLGVTLVSIERPLVAVLRSAARAGLPTRGVWPRLVRIQDMLDVLPPDVTRYRYDALTPADCAAIFERCRGRPCPAGWLDRWFDCRVEADHDAANVVVQQNAEGLRAFYGGA